MIVILAVLTALHCGDDYHLKYESARAGLPEERILAIARVESACNLDTRLRAHNCNPRDCERGRFQIKPSTARRACPDLDTRRYTGNVACFFRIFGENVRRFGLTEATVRQNGYGPAGAYEFLYKVLKVEESL